VVEGFGDDPSTIESAFNGPPPHRFAAGRSATVPRGKRNRNRILLEVAQQECVRVESWNRCADWTPAQIEVDDT